jgi:hypothetical protein
MMGSSAISTLAGRLGKLPERRLTLIVALFATLAGAIWALSSPLMSVPDEPAHVLKAVGIWHGQEKGTRTVGVDPLDPARPYIYYVVKVPESYATVPDLYQCYFQDRNKPASCAPSLGSGTAMREAQPSAGGYPPLYYVIVGWPSRFLPASSGIYLLRIVSVVVCALLFALAFTALRGIVPTWLRLGAVTLAATPEVWFLAGSVNPNGFEIAAGAAAWATLLALTIRARRGMPIGTRLCLATALSVLLLTATRPLSPLLAGLVVVFVLATSGRTAIGAMWHSRRVRVTFGVITAGIVATAIMIVFSRQLETITGGSRLPEYFNAPARLLLLVHVWFAQMVAAFGWLEFGPIATSVYGWLMAFTLAGGAAFLFGRRREVARAAGVLAMAAFGPVLLQYQALRESGYYVWQGRYFLPIAIGLPFLLVLALRDSSEVKRVRTRFIGALVVVTGVAQIVAHTAAARRYAVGDSGRLAYFIDPQWSPPGGWMLWLGATVMLWLAWGLFGVGVAAGRLADDPPLNGEPRGLAPAGETAPPRSPTGSRTPLTEPPVD